MNDLWGLNNRLILEPPVDICEREERIYIYDPSDSYKSTTAWLSAQEEDVVELYENL